MTPPKQVWVIVDITLDGEINLIEAHSSKDGATAALESIKEDATEPFIEKVELKSIPKEIKEKSPKAQAAEEARKTMPPGRANALTGLKILITGKLDIDRKTSEATVATYGGTIAKKIEDSDYVVLGTKPGDKKLEEISKHAAETLTEKQFLDMLQTGVPMEKYKRMAIRASSEEDEPVKKKQRKK